MGASASENSSWNWANQFLNSNSSNQSQSSSFVNPSQSQFLASLYGDATAAADPAAAGRAAGKTTALTLPGMRSDFTKLGALTDPSKQIATQTAALKTGLGSLFAEEINPAIQTEALATGGFGGGRQGVAEGVATGQLADAFTTGVADITANANQTALDAVGARSSLAQSIFGQAVGAETAGLTPLQMLSGILGPATVLQKSKSTGKSKSRGRSRSEGGSSGQSAGFSLAG